MHHTDAYRTSKMLLAALGALITSAATHGQAVSEAPKENLAVAKYTTDGRLQFPQDVDRWVFLGSTIGGNYSDQAFDPQNPGTIGVVQIEPSAYAYLLRNKQYANGTMLLLTFYAVQEKPEPALQGFVQGDVVGRELHVIDRDRFEAEGRAFFRFPAAATDAAAAIPTGSPCVQCHGMEGAFDATFTQFYPAVRSLLSPDER